MNNPGNVVVTHAHGDYERGSIIVDPDEAEAALRDHPTKVVRIKPDIEVKQ